MPKTQAECDVTNPREMFAWIFPVGIPDARNGQQEGRKFPNQPFPYQHSFEALSEMLYKFGCRFHPELQEMWVVPASGPLKNFATWVASEVEPKLAEFAVDQFPEVVERVSKVKPENHQEALKEQAEKLLDAVARLKAAQAKLPGAADGGNT